MSGFVFEETNIELNKFAMLLEKGKSLTNEEFNYVKFFPCRLAVLLITEYGEEKALTVANIIQNLVG